MNNDEAIKRAWARGEPIEYTPSKTEGFWVRWGDPDRLIMDLGLYWRLAEERRLPDNWDEIKEAWAEGKDVQYEHSEGRWASWSSRDNLTPVWQKWRIKPQSRKARMVVETATGLGLLAMLVWREGEDEPTPSAGCEWLGDWVEVPQ